MWTFLKLNTQDGRIWQVQYDLSGNNRFETYLNLTPLAFGEDKKTDDLPFIRLRIFGHLYCLIRLTGKHGRSSGVRKVSRGLLFRLSDRLQ